MRHWEIRQQSFDSVPATCPTIDESFDRCLQVVKETTNNFRNALNEWIERALEAEDLVQELESKINEYEKIIIDLEDEIEILKDNL